MKKIGFEIRYNQLLILIGLLMISLVIRLFVLSVLQHETWVAEANTISVKSVYSTAPRGKIMDRYGRVLAGNVQSFSITFSDDNMTSEETNEIAGKLMDILIENNENIHDNLPIKIENGTYFYTYEKEIESWLQSQYLPLNYTATQAFEALRDIYEISPALDVYETQRILQSDYRLYPPISVKAMEYTSDLNKKRFLESYNLEETLSAQEAFNAIWDRFGIDKNLSPEEVRKIIVVRNELKERGYHQYMSAILASDIKDGTIIDVEERSKNLKGVEVVSETKRVYPNGNTAAHVLGYLGKISEENKRKYIDELGYGPNDLIGQSGIERVYEPTLKGKDGVSLVQVNSRGEKVKVISNTPPESGKDVYLTIDLDLQKTAEEALKKGLNSVRNGGVFESIYGNYQFGRVYKKADVGAIVALDVKTGEVLAMASFPDYDPNLFATGIKPEDWAALQSKNPRDYLSPAPLYNVAARSAIQPGSTFKMVTGLAAMECGMDPKKRLYDGGYIQVGNRPYACLAWHMGRGSHGAVNLAEALEVSCNYYFYDVSTGKDYYTGQSLNYKKNIDVSTIMHYAKEFGLGEATGIEIGETVAPLPSAKGKMEAMKNMLTYNLTLNASKYFNPETLSNKEVLNKNISTIVGWIEENPSRNEIIRRLPDMGVLESSVEPLTDLCKYSFFNQAKWTLGDVFSISIGQGENAYTPLQMANFAATLGNKGVKNKVSIIANIEDQVKAEKEPGKKMDISNDEYLNELIKGMNLVTSGSRGPLRSAFVGFPIQVAAKTGTAEKEGYISWPDEVEYVKTYLRQIDSSLNWTQVEEEMNRLLTSEPENYPTRDIAVRRALINLGGGRITSKTIDRFKDTYDPFAWLVAVAPAEDPQIAVSVLIFQGGMAGYAAPIAREVIGKYLQLEDVYTSYSLETKMQ